MGLGAGATPAPQPGLRGLAPAFSRVELVVFFPVRADLVRLTGPSLFCWAPAKRGGWGFFFALSVSSASLFQLSFRMRFV